MTWWIFFLENTEWNTVRPVFKRSTVLSEENCYKRTNIPRATFQSSSNSRHTAADTFLLHSPLCSVFTSGRTCHGVKISPSSFPLPAADIPKAKIAQERRPIWRLELEFTAWKCWRAQGKKLPPKWPFFASAALKSPGGKKSTNGPGTRTAQVKDYHMSLSRRRQRSRHVIISFGTFSPTAFKRQQRHVGFFAVSKLVENWGGTYVRGRRAEIPTAENSKLSFGQKGDGWTELMAIIVLVWQHFLVNN